MNRIDRESRSSAARRRTTLMLTVLACEAAVISVAAAPLARRPAEAVDQVLMSVVAVTGVAGALGLGGAGLLLLVVRHGTEDSGRAPDARAATWPGAVLLGLAAYSLVGPLTRLLEPGTPASLLGWCGRGMVTVVCCTLLLWRVRRPVHLLGAGLFVVFVGLAVLSLLQTRLGDTMEADPATRVLAETGLVVTWWGCALLLAVRDDEGIGPWRAWQLALLWSGIHVLRALDGTQPGYASLAAVAVAALTGYRVVQVTCGSMAPRQVDPGSGRTPRDARREVRTGVAQHDAARKHDHDVRSTCTSARFALELLCSHDRALDEGTERILRDAALRSLHQLEQLITPDRPGAGAPHVAPGGDDGRAPHLSLTRSGS